jgi:probable selenium-dependent hydroxylase accessory protein YqeC
VEKRTGSLTEALFLGERAHAALVGAGGKTTLMTLLCKELRGSGIVTAASTTTKVHVDEARRFPCLLLMEEERDPDEAIGRCLNRHGSVFIGRRLLANGKVEGVSCEAADGLFFRRDLGCLIVEADGAARMPVKAPAEHEPVVPSSATHVVALIGLEAMDKPFEPQRVFRPEILASLTGLKDGDRLSPEAVGRLFLHPLGLFKGSPEGASRIAFVNKADLAHDQGSARRLASILLSEGRAIERVILGSLKAGDYIVFLRGMCEGTYRSTERNS